MKKLSYLLFLAVLVWGCQDEFIPQEETIDYQGGEMVKGIYVGLGTRSDSWSLEDEYEKYAQNVGPREEKPYIIDHFNDGDILFISQMGTTETPKLYFQGDTTNVKPKYTKETVESNLYVYQYKTPETPAQWDGGSNFVPYINARNDSTPMNWTAIKNLGSIGNAFSFYAMFQADNETPNCRTVTWMNYKIHSAEELGKRYGLFGAYHATSSLYTRMRFRMYPLFNLLHVTLLVPVQEATTDKPGYTGFGPNVFKNNWEAGNSQKENLPGVWFGVPAWANRTLNAAQRGIGSSFDIDWRANRSSDNDPPLISPIWGSSNICFYLLKYDLDDPYAEHPPFEITNVKEFYPNADRETDMVRRYEFIAYYVAQNTMTASGANAILSFRLLTPGSSGDLYRVPDSMYDYPMSVEGSYVPYFFYGNNKNQGQITGGDSDLGFQTQGAYQHLTLYVPRKGNETILVSAKVTPWKNTYTEMTVVEREDETDPEN